MSARSPVPLAPRGESPLTLRAVGAGAAVGAAVAGMNISFGLKAGWTQGGSVIAAVLSMGLFDLIKPPKPFTALEANIAQTVASAAGTMASAGGFVSAIPALSMLGHEYDLFTLMAWATSVAFIGVFFAVPLRNQLIVKEQLRFPSGLATYEVIKAMQPKHKHKNHTNTHSTICTSIDSPAESESDKSPTEDMGPDPDPDTGNSAAQRQARALLLWAAASGVFTLCVYFVPQLETPPLLEHIGLSSVAVYGWALTFDPLLCGGGMLAGPRVGFSVLFGALLSWGFLGPLVQHLGWTSGPIMDTAHGMKGWLLWPGVAIMVADALANLLVVVVPTVLRSVRAVCTRNCGRVAAVLYGQHNGTEEERQRIVVAGDAHSKDTGNVVDRAGAAPSGVSQDVEDIDITLKHSDRGRAVWTELFVSYREAGAGVLLASIGTTLVLWRGFALALWEPPVAIVLSFFLAYIAVRCSGETDINPVGGVGKVSQLVFAVLAPGQLVTNLMAAMVVAAGASQCADVMHDLKTGYMMRAQPREQFLAQLVGIPIGVVVSVPIYTLFAAAYTFGESRAVPAPAAEAWRAVAEVLADGFSSLPDHVPEALLCAFVLAFALVVIKRILHLRSSPYVQFVPSGTSIGIAFIIYPNQSLVLFAGSMVFAAWRSLRPQSCEELHFAVASGLIAGAGLMGVVNAGLSLGGVPTLA